MLSMLYDWFYQRLNCINNIEQTLAIYKCVDRLPVWLSLYKVQALNTASIKQNISQNQKHQLPILIHSKCIIKLFTNCQNLHTQNLTQFILAGLIHTYFKPRLNYQQVIFQCTTFSLMDCSYLHPLEVNGIFFAGLTAHGGGPLVSQVVGQWVELHLQQTNVLRSLSWSKFSRSVEQLPMSHYLLGKSDNYVLWLHVAKNYQIKLYIY